MPSCANRAVPEGGRKEEGICQGVGRITIVSLQGLFSKLHSQLDANPIAIQEFGMEYFQTSPYDALICYTTEEDIFRSLQEKLHLSPAKKQKYVAFQFIVVHFLLFVIACIGASDSRTLERPDK